jgi:5-methylcytosine-specific restriction endonuclease McrA
LTVFKGKATILEAHPTERIRSATQTWDVPVQIVLKSYVKVKPTHRTPAKWNKRHMFIRDNHTCQYCHRHRDKLPEGNILTIDHVYPQELGGRTEWENVVTACTSCNNKKANKQLHELGWKLRRLPYTPTMYEIWSKTTSKYFDPVNVNLGA